MSHIILLVSNSGRTVLEEPCFKLNGCAAALKINYYKISYARIPVSWNKPPLFQIQSLNSHLIVSSSLASVVL